MGREPENYACDCCLDDGFSKKAQSALYVYCHFYYANVIAETGMTNFMVGANVQVLIRARQ